MAGIFGASISVARDAGETRSLPAASDVIEALQSAHFHEMEITSVSLDVVYAKLGSHEQGKLVPALQVSVEAMGRDGGHAMVLLL